ncbi:MAG: ATP-binding protein [Gammaproteobacteria bacterium]|jgi:PAS domain S-box-containing protein|nr:ATP-binding protein [Gammaproteobacteria bacterium]
MDFKRLKRGFYITLIGAMLLLGASDLVLLWWTAQNLQEFGRLHNILLAGNVVGVCILIILILGNLVRLVRDNWQQVPGSKLKARMLAAIVGLVVAPLIVVYLFAVLFLYRGIDTWFDIEIQGGLQDALSLSSAALDSHIYTSMENSQQIAAALLRSDDSDLVRLLGQLRRDAGAIEATLYGRNYLIVATSHQDVSAPFPSTPPEDVMLQVRKTGSYVGIDPIGLGTYQVRAAILLANARLGQEPLVLQAIYPVGERIGVLVDSVETTYSRYNELVFLREPLKASFALTLTLVVLLSVLLAVYGAFLFARRLVAPILSVVAGTRAVAAGDFDSRLSVTSHDEIGFLIDSFNQMIQRLSQAREEARLSEQRVDKERAHVEAILARLSTGVIAFESDGRIRLANDAANAMLETNLTGVVGRWIGDLIGVHATLAEFMAGIQEHLESADTEWREQVSVQSASGRRVFVCASTALPADEGEPGGSIIVFDDVTTLLQAQRDAAWGEVARRMAHEIKNPLTPIQLSAERIQRRYLSGMKEMEAEVLSRATNTIIAQVEAMRNMVNAFSEYARAPEIHISRFDLNQLIREVVSLYWSHDNHAQIRLNLDTAIGDIDADNARIRQLLHNLIRNAFEAMEGQEEMCLDITTCMAVIAGRDYAEIRISDDGSGIDPETIDRLFDPYVTTKNKGTGLGLAIVKKLVEEHGGTVSAKNLQQGGAIMTVRLPIRRVTGTHEYHGVNKVSTERAS